MRGTQRTYSPLPEIFVQLGQMDQYIIILFSGPKSQVTPYHTLSSQKSIIVVLGIELSTLSLQDMSLSHV